MVRSQSGITNFQEKVPLKKRERSTRSTITTHSSEGATLGAQPSCCGSLSSFQRMDYQSKGGYEHWPQMTTFILPIPLDVLYLRIEEQSSPTRIEICKVALICTKEKKTHLGTMENTAMSAMLPLQQRQQIGYRAPRGTGEKLTRSQKAAKDGNCKQQYEDPYK